AVVHLLALPAATRRLPVDADVALRVERHEAPPVRVAAEPRRGAAGLADPHAVRPGEHEKAVVGRAHVEPALVHQPVMERAERNEIGELRLPYQTVIYWPGSAAIEIRSIDDY